NIRLNAFDESFKQLDTVNDQLNIAFLNDFVSSKAKVEFRPQRFNHSCNLFELHPPMWSKRKYMIQQESTIGKYLVTPANNDLTNAFYNLLYLTLYSFKNDTENRIPTLTIDRTHHALKSDLDVIHKRTDWVVNLDSILDKKILEEFGANVIKYRKARHINRNLVISSKANTILLENHLVKKFRDFQVREDIVKNAVDSIVKSANELSGDVLLKAIGRGRFANEMLGLVLTKTILEGCSSNQNILILIDDYADWFLSSISSEEKLLLAQNNVLADILAITPVFDGEKLTTLYIDVVESKFCNESSRAQMAKKSLQQTKDSYTLFSKVFEDNTYVDKDYWLSKISDLIVENHHKSFVGNLTSEDIRNAIRTDKSIKFIVRGMSFVCVYDYEENYQPETGIENVTQYIIGSKSIVKMIEDLPQFDLMLPELKLPSYALEIKPTTSSEEAIQEEVVRDERLPSNIEAAFTQITTNTSSDSTNTESEANARKNAEDIAKKEDAEQAEGEAVSTAVKQVVMHHGYRAKILKYLFTPNAIRVSLEPELGWNENIFYKMSNDFLAVKMLKLLRVEVVPGSYDLVFSRRERQVILYEDCLVNRELSNGPGNTKILLGRNEEDNGVVYYNLDSEDPHALIGGMTKSGKSVLLNIFIVDLIRTNTPEELRLILVDPKQVEFTRYRGIPYLDETGIITKKEQAIEKLHSVVDEMERRYSLFAETGVNEINKYNRKVETKIPRIVLIFDEFADWMLDDEFKREASSAVQSLSGKARAAGIHLIVSTQRPDNSVVVPILRANLGAKFALRVDSEKNSAIILDDGGAEKLLGYGHMIVKFAGEKQHIQTAFMSDDYIDSVLELIKDRSETL
ncbi:MAG: FtsK/SpoIIIE domain-containing protein, partial [Bacteroidales bacterium]|nr:FtsK/SpoIIIE domain-containing protein [Bacteroidales bacterium]